MPAGTIALTNNSATVTGTGTSFTTELKVGDFIGVVVGSAPYTLVVSSIASNTQLTISVPFNGPSASGLAWHAVPASLKIAITQQILNDMGTVARGMIMEKANWQKIFSSDQSVTVTRPDRTEFTGPSWGYMASQFDNKAELVNGAVAITQGGTGQKTASAGWKALLDGRTSVTARNDLGLGTAATLAANTASIGNGGWFQDSATKWIVQKGSLSVPAASTRDYTLPIGFAAVATCVVVCAIRSQGTGFSTTGEVMADMVSAGIIRLSNTNAIALPVDYIIIGW